MKPLTIEEIKKYITPNHDRSSFGTGQFHIGTINEICKIAILAHEMKKALEYISSAQYEPPYINIAIFSKANEALAKWSEE